MIAVSRLFLELRQREMGDIDGDLEGVFEFAQRQREVGHPDASDHQHVYIALRRPLPPRHRAEDEGEVDLFPKWLQRDLDLIGQANSFGEEALQFRQQGMGGICLVIHPVAVHRAPQDTRLGQRRQFALKAGRRDFEAVG